jgi:hypothetical protein
MIKLKLSMDELWTYKIALWTQDNHHQTITLQLYNYFFKIYAAYSKFYNPKLFPNLSHLPCCFAAEDIKKVYLFNNLNFQNRFYISPSFILHEGYD